MKAKKGLTKKESDDSQHTRIHTNPLNETNPVKMFSHSGKPINST